MRNDRESHLLKTWAFLGLTSAFVLCVQVRFSLAADIIEAVPLAHSVVIIDQQSGAVTQCTGLLNTTLQQPVGSCGQIGTVTPPPTGTNLITKNEDYFVFVLNSAARTLFSCLANFNAQTLAPTGTCNVAMRNVP
jgi:hypothetical protein